MRYKWWKNNTRQGDSLSVTEVLLRKQNNQYGDNTNFFLSDKNCKSFLLFPGLITNK